MTTCCIKNCQKYISGLHSETGNGQQATRPETEKWGTLY